MQAAATPPPMKSTGTFWSTASASTPARPMAIGMVPMIRVIMTLMTRPRSWSGVVACMSVVNETIMTPMNTPSTACATRSV